MPCKKRKGKKKGR